MSSSKSKSKGLIFETNTTARYTTVEFDYKAKINSVGLRNIEFKTNKENRTYRILCFGDSWTFGWGVDIEYSWPMQLGNYLKQNGYIDTEVINCGQGGQYTSGYKKYISTVVPLLKPDLVLVGVLQLDDLAQIYENKYPNKNFSKINSSINLFSKIKFSLNEFFKASLGNYLKILNKQNKEITIKSSWMSGSNDVINGFNKLQTLRYTTLSDTVQTLFNTGNLNPSLLNYYINFPDRITIFNNPNHPATRFAIKEMDNDFKEMKAVCEANKSNIIFLNLPLNNFTGHIVIRTPSDILNDFFQSNNHIDSIYHNIAVSNKLNYFELTNHFINLKDKEKYFFKFDGHPNENGYREIAVEIGKHLITQNIITKNP